MSSFTSNVYTKVLQKLESLKNASIRLDDRPFPVEVQVDQRPVDRGMTTDIATSRDRVTEWNIGIFPPTEEAFTHAFKDTSNALETLKALRNAIATESGLKIHAEIPEPQNTSAHLLDKRGGEYQAISGSIGGGISAGMQYLTCDAKKVADAVRTLRDRAAGGQKIAGRESQEVLSVLDAMQAALRPAVMRINMNEQPVDVGVRVSAIGEMPRYLGAPQLMGVKIMAPLEQEPTHLVLEKERIFTELLKAVAEQARIPPIIETKRVGNAEATLQFDRLNLPHVIRALETLQSRPETERPGGAGSMAAQVRAREADGGGGGRSRFGGNDSRPPRVHRDPTRDETSNK